MQLTLSEIRDYDSDIAPFLQNGVLIDTSVLYEILEGIVLTRISKKASPEFDDILKFIDFLKLSNKWNKFFVTPHILTEICTHLRNNYEKQMKDSYCQIVGEIIPILKEMSEFSRITKNEILEYIDLKVPVVEVGDISIFLAANDFIQNKKYVAILVKDAGIAWKYIDHPHVLVMDYRSVILNTL